MNKDFNRGDRVVLVNREYLDGSCLGAEVGAKATVMGGHGEYLQLVWDAPQSQSDGNYDYRRFQVLTDENKPVINKPTPPTTLERIAKALETLVEQGVIREHLLTESVRYQEVSNARQDKLTRNILRTLDMGRPTEVVEEFNIDSWGQKG